MSYDLAVWEGERPATDEAALARYLDLYDKHVAGESSSPPAPRIRSYVEALLQRWPDIDVAESSPWSDSPLMGNACGPIFYFGMVYSQADEAAAFASELAAKHGLICFDPQEERLRP